MAVIFKSTLKPSVNTGSMFSAGVSESSASAEAANDAQLVSENFVGFLPIWVHHLKSITAAVTLGAIVYWYLPSHGKKQGKVTRRRKDDADNVWMRKTHKELAEETGLSAQQVKDALTRLKGEGVIEMATGGAFGKRTTWIRLKCAEGSGTLESREAVAFERPAKNVHVRPKGEKVHRPKEPGGNGSTDLKHPKVKGLQTYSNTGVTGSEVTVSGVTGVNDNPTPEVPSGEGKPNGKGNTFPPPTGGTPSPIALPPSPKKVSDQQEKMDVWSKKKTKLTEEERAEQKAMGLEAMAAMAKAKEQQAA